MANPYPLRIPDDLRRLMQGDADKRGRSLAQTMIAACWAYLERGDTAGVAQLAEHRPHKPEEVGSSPAPSTKPVIAALRSICAGQVGREAEVAEIVSVDSAPQLCPHKEWAEDGEQYRCALVAGHKGKCVLGDKLE